MGEMNEEEVKRILEKKLKEASKEMKETLDKMFQELRKTVAKAVAEMVMEMNEKLDKKSSKVEELEDMISAFMVKERKSSDEVQEERKDLIVGLRDLSLDGSTIGVKKIPNEACNENRLSSEERVEGQELRKSTRPRFRNKKYLD